MTALHSLPTCISPPSPENWTRNVKWELPTWNSKRELGWPTWLYGYTMVIYFFREILVLSLYMRVHRENLYQMNHKWTCLNIVLTRYYSVVQLTHGIPHPLLTGFPHLRRANNSSHAVTAGKSHKSLRAPGRVQLLVVFNAWQQFYLRHIYPLEYNQALIQCIASCRKSSFHV